MTKQFIPANPDWRANIEALFQQAPFIRALGCRIVEMTPGSVTTEMSVEPHHQQHNGFVHAGAQATLADHTSGAAAATLMPSDRNVLTIEFKISLLAPARGDRLICRAEVLKPGRSVSFVEARIFAVTGSEQKLVSHATVSLALAQVPAKSPT